ncbi:glycosyltransferase [Stutzerimonas nitrititolerans]|uniref:glycosyltransferase n=2 Tax=Stutzerimonas TaxID=2901164 RepID=UPI002896B83F|nr:glycosyltransferase [Stutzerimonas nitrititolerans]
MITATYNAMGCLPRLFESLRLQTDQSFEWVVADGASTDGTLEYLLSITCLDLKVIQGPDFGIYDALNKAIKQSKGEYYIVIGADDSFSPDAVEKFKSYIDSEVDMVAACIRTAGRLVRPGRGASWLYGQYEYVAGHAVGTLFRKSLHNKFGFYSRKFPIAADQLFIKTVCQGGANVCRADFEAGTFGDAGLSALDIAGTLCEFFRVQLLTERHYLPQVIIFIIRLIRHSLKLGK